MKINFSVSYLLMKLSRYQNKKRDIKAQRTEAEDNFKCLVSTFKLKYQFTFKLDTSTKEGSWKERQKKSKEVGSCGYTRRLVNQRLWVRIPARDTM